MKKIIARGSVAKVPEEIRRVFVTSLDITAEYHIEMQAVIQKYCCNAISKTVNFKFEATEEEVRTGFIEAWRHGCKGLTVYRNGS
jgi:ribonucleoside-diphosphate reductase alpha chain